MANRTGYPLVVEGKNELKLVLAHFVGNATSSPTSYDTKEISAVSRSAVGTFDLTLRHKYPTEQHPIVSVHGSATTGIHARVSAWDSAAGTMSIVTSKVPGVPAWTTGVTVTSHAATLAVAGYVVAVDATTATSAGGKILQASASPAQGFVRVVYAASGIATLTFNATDNVTAASVLIAPAGPVDLATTDRVYITLEVRNTGVNVT